MKVSHFWSTVALAGAFAGLAAIGSADVTGSTTQSLTLQTPDDTSVESPGPWLGRVRLFDFVPADHSAPFSYLGGNFAPHALTVSQKFGFEGDLSYFFQKCIAAELGVFAPMQNNVNLIGGSPLGTLTQEPVTLTLQYHVQVPHLPVNAYVGLGVDYSRVTESRLSALGHPLSVTRNMTGFTYQFGFDVAVAQGFYVNFDFRHMQLATNLKDDNTNKFLTDANMTPNVYSIGVGYRF